MKTTIYSNMSTGTREVAGLGGTRKSEGSEAAGRGEDELLDICKLSDYSNSSWLTDVQLDVRNSTGAGTEVLHEGLHVGVQCL